MRLHTDGSSIILLSPEGRLHWRKNGRTTSEPIPPNSDVSDFDRSGTLCLTPSGERDFSARIVSCGAIVGDAIDEDNVAAVIMDDGQAYLVRGPVSIDGDWKSVIDLGAIKPTRAQWPAGLIWKKGDKSLYDMAEANGHGVPATFIPTLECNKFGTAIASAGSGAVVVVRPDSRAVDFSIQVPTQEEQVIYACPTEQGVLVTIIIDAQDSAIVHIAEDGTILGHRSADRSAPALLLDAGILVFDDSKCTIDLCDAALKPLTSLDMPFPAVDSSSAADGASFAFANAENILLGHVNAKTELVIVDTFCHHTHSGSRKRPGEIAAAEARWDPERSHGKTAVGFAAGISQQAWTATADEAFELIMQARSTGGAGHGIEILIGGDALKNAEFEAVAVDGARKDFTQDKKGNYTAVFKDVELVQGLQYPLNPKPKNDVQKHAAAMFLAETHIELKVYGKAKGASGDLLSLSISALGSDRPPLKWMRPLSIT